MSKIPMLEKFAAQSLVEHDGELIFSKEKFAELIVKECVAQIDIERGNPYRNIGDINEYGISACVESIRRIKEHFGVEE